MQRIIYECWRNLGRGVKSYWSFHFVACRIWLWLNILKDFDNAALCQDSICCPGLYDVSQHSALRSRPNTHVSIYTIIRLCTISRLINWAFPIIFLAWQYLLFLDRWNWSPLSKSQPSGKPRRQWTRSIHRTPARHSSAGAAVDVHVFIMRSTILSFFLLLYIQFLLVPNSPPGANTKRFREHYSRHSSTTPEYSRACSMVSGINMPLPDLFSSSWRVRRCYGLVSLVHHDVAICRKLLAYNRE